MRNDRLNHLKNEKKNLEKIISDYYAREQESHMEPEEDSTGLHFNVPEVYSDEQKLRKIEEEIRSIEHASEIRRQKEEFEKESLYFKKAEVVEDKIADIDLLERSFLAGVISSFITDGNDKKVNVGVFGEWGKGKSSFLELMYTKIISKKDSRLKLIRIDASRYNKCEEIWTLILKSIFDKYMKEKPFVGEFQYLFVGLKNELQINKRRGIINVGIVIILFLLYKNGNINFGDDFAIASLTMSPIILVILNVMKSFATASTLLSEKYNHFVTKNMPLGNFDKLNIYKEKVIQEYKKIIGLWLNRGERIILFIDELDRVDTEHVMQFFESLQLFIDSEEISFVFSLDINIICMELVRGKKFEYDDAMKYLEKYINIPVYLNDRIPYDKYIGSILNEKITYSDHSHEDEENLILQRNQEFENTDQVFTLKNKEVDYIVGWTKYYKCNNPREIKKLVNLILISKNIHFERSMDTLVDEKSHITDFKEYITWFFYAYFNKKNSRTISDMVWKSDEQEKTVYDIAGNSIGLKALPKAIEGLRGTDVKEFVKISDLFLGSV